MIAELQDTELVKIIKEKNELSNDAIIELTNRHKKMISSLYEKYNAKLSASGTYPYDIFTNPECLVYNAALTYDDTRKTKYSSWLYTSITFDSLNAIYHGNKNLKLENSQIDYINQLNNPSSIDKENEYCNLHKYIEDIPDELTKKIIKDRFFDNRIKSRKKKRKWKTICRLYDINHKTAVKLKDNGLKFLKEKIEQNNNK